VAAFAACALVLPLVGTANAQPSDGTPDEAVYTTTNVDGVNMNCYWIQAGGLNSAFKAGFAYPPVIVTGNHGWLLCYPGDPHRTL
jgi:hypothetical protein